MGATIIALCIITVWTRTVHGESDHPHLYLSSYLSEQFTHLAGIAAPVEYQNLVTYKVRLFLPFPHLPLQ
jgi:hypothetical protein